MWEKTTKEHRVQEVRILGASLEGSYHSGTCQSLACNAFGLKIQLSHAIEYMAP